MARNLEPFREVEFEVLFERAAEEASAPAAPASVCNGTADAAAGGEEEDGDVWVDLGDDAEVDVEVQVQRARGDVGAEGAVFPFCAEGVGGDSAAAAARLRHEDDGVEDAWDGGGGKDRAEDAAVGGREVVE